MDKNFGIISKCGIFDSDIERPNIKKSPKRQLNEFEIELFIYHNGTSFLNDKEYNPQPNTLIIAKPNEYRTSILGFKCFFIHLKLPNDSIYYNKLISCPNYYCVINSDKYREVFESIIYYHNIKGFNTEEDIVKAKLIELFYYLVDDKKYNSKIISKSQQQIGEIIKYINNHYDEKLSLESLAKKVNYSKNYFQFLFKSVMGVSPQEYITNVRIRHAKELLSESNYSLVDICFMCGFSSQSYFNYVFKNQTNQSPLKYRQNITSMYPIK